MKSRRSGAPTVADVARLAGVSTQSVSRVVNDAPGVGAETRARVLRSMKRLGYTPSPFARGLARNRSGAIGVVHAHSGVVGQELFLAGIERAAREAGFSPRVTSVRRNDPRSLGAAFAALQEELVEGVIVIGNSTMHAQSALLASMKLPVVFFGGQDVVGARLSSLSFDNRGGAERVVEHLARRPGPLGHIAGPSGWIDAGARTDAWKACAPMPRLRYLRRGDWSARSGYQAMTELLREGVRSVFAANDYMALGALKACFDASLRVPDDIAVAGFDNVVGADYFQPPLTTVSMPFPELGVRAVDLLVELIRGGEPQNLVLPVSLVVRSSS